MMTSTPRMNSHLLSSSSIVAAQFRSELELAKQPASYSTMNLMPTSSLSPPVMPSVRAVISRGWSMALNRPDMDIFFLTGFSPMGTEFHMPPSKLICMPLPLSPGLVPARPTLPVMTGRAAIAAAFHSPLWWRCGP